MKPGPQAAVVTNDERDTEAFGERLAAGLSDSDVVYLLGQLGAGKTCLARGLARGRGASAREVASPTFALVHEYAGGSGEIVLRHLDLYRLRDRAEDLDVLGLPDAFTGAPVAVEWPGQAIRRLLPPTLEVRIEVLPGGARRLSATGPSPTRD